MSAHTPAAALCHYQRGEIHRLRGEYDDAEAAYRGAVADDRKTGDGAGILTQLPYEFFKRELLRVGIQPPVSGDLAVGQLFLFRQDADDRERRTCQRQRAQFLEQAVDHLPEPFFRGWWRALDRLVMNAVMLGPA